MSSETSSMGLLTETVSKYWLKQLNCIENRLNELDWVKADTIHDLRVAARRCQSTAAACKPYLPAGLITRILRILKPLRKACDQVRDAEVLLDWLISLPEPQLITAGLLDVLRHQYDQALKDLKQTIADNKLKRKICSLRHNIQMLQTQPEPVSYRVEDVAAAMLTTGMAAITVYHQSIDLAASPDAVSGELHQLRIAGKQFRYVLEMLQPALSDSSQTLLEQFIRFQDSLGAIHDRFKFSEIINKLSENSNLQKAMPEQIFTMLANELSRQRQLCWQDFLQLWKRVTAKEMNGFILSIL